ncbi:hypothetical protein KEM52_002755, partial [Ascosphaera acerosa]
MSQSQRALAAQRTSIRQERKAFDEERRLWNHERECLRAQVAELERELAEARASTPRPAAADAAATAPRLRPSQSRQHSFTTATNTAPGIAVGSGGDRDASPVWQGSSPLRKPTRTFATSTSSADPSGKLEPTPMTLNAALSPSTGGHLRVPVELVDSTLDGIMLKSTALPADVVARVKSPSITSSSPRSQPSPAHVDSEAQAAATASEDVGSGQPRETESQSEDTQAAEHNDKDTSHDVSAAGNPPRDTITNDNKDDDDNDNDDNDDNDDEITEELEHLLSTTAGKQPLPPTPPIPKDDMTVQEQLEDGLADLPEDICLKGPLNLRNDIHHDQAFLSVLDRKLLSEAHRLLASPGLSDDDV